ncbi:hypothetical protein OG912_00020 [Streptomyces sp. NBC_00464]
MALTCWEAADLDDPLVPRIRAVQLLRDLHEAGFADVDVRQRPDWRQAERTCGRRSSPSRRPTRRCGRCRSRRRSLETFASLRRVFATATAP